MTPAPNHNDSVDLHTALQRSDVTGACRIQQTHHQCDPSQLHRLLVDADSVLDSIGYWLLFDEAEAAINEMDAALPIPPRLVEDTDESQTEQWLVLRAEQGRLAALRRALDRLELADTSAFAVALRHQLRDSAALMFPKMTIEVQVDVRAAGHRGDGQLQPQECGRLAMIVEVARLAAVLPSSGQPLSDYPEDVAFAEVERAANLTPLVRIEQQGSSATGPTPSEVVK